MLADRCIAARFSLRIEVTTHDGSVREPAPGGGAVGRTDGARWNRAYGTILGMVMLVVLLLGSALILQAVLTADDHCPEGSEPRPVGVDPTRAHETLRCGVDGND